MLKGILAVSLGLALSAVPAWGQMGHQHDHQVRGAGEAMASDTVVCPGYGMMGMQGAMGLPGMMGAMGAPNPQGMGMWSGNVAGMATMPMMGGRFPAPQFLLAMREDLNLSPDQVKGLERLQARTYEEAQEEMDVAQRQEPEFDSSTELSGEDTEAYIQGLRNYIAHMTEVRIAMVRAGIEARDLLTPDQRTQLKEAFGNWGMRGHRRGMMMGGMSDGHGAHHPESGGSR